MDSNLISWLLFTTCLSVSHDLSAGWQLLNSEDFSGHWYTKSLEWLPENTSGIGRYTDAGTFFYENNPNFSLPKAYRSEISNEWLKVSLYSRKKKLNNQFLSKAIVTKDGIQNALRVRSSEHTDGIVLGSINPLPAEYKVCVNSGYAEFGDGLSLPNGYDGDEHAGPWLNVPAVHENGLYWLAITSEPPKPRNNIWIHHHRKAAVDSDNNLYPDVLPQSWTYIWNSTEYIVSGNNPVTMFVIDAENKDKSWNFDRLGMPFIAYSGKQWNSQAKVNQIRAVDSYLPNHWYKTCIWKTRKKYGLEISGTFKYGGKKTYKASIPLQQVYMASSHPDYFMLGDPHINFYEGQFLVDSIELFHWVE